MGLLSAGFLAGSASTLACSVFGVFSSTISGSAATSAGMFSCAGAAAAAVGALAEFEDTAVVPVVACFRMSRMVRRRASSRFSAGASR